MSSTTKYREPESSCPPQLFHSPGDGNAPGSYHRGEFFVGVVGEDTVAVVAGHDPVLLYELQDNSTPEINLVCSSSNLGSALVGPKFSCQQ